MTSLTARCWELHRVRPCLWQWPWTRKARGDGLWIGLFRGEGLDVLGRGIAKHMWNMYVLDVGVSKTKYWQKSRSSWFASRERRFLCLMRFHAVIQPFQWQSEPNPLQISLITSMALKTHNVLHRFLDLCLGQGVRDTHTHTQIHIPFFFFKRLPILFGRQPSALGHQERLQGTSIFLPLQDDDVQLECRSRKRRK